jgi:phosphate transport system permease protein
MKFDRAGRRKIKSLVMALACFACVIIALIPLASILFTAVQRGAPAFNVDFFTENIPPPCNSASGPCISGGIWNAIEGGLIMLALAAAIAIPLGVLAGVFLSEYGHIRFVRWMRFFIDVMTGIPSIVVGIFVYALFLDYANLGLFNTSWVLSALAGAVSLSIIMLPIVARATDESLRLVPVTMREAGHALGIRRWRVTTSVVLSTGRTAVVTGILLAVARAGGETAPLLMTTIFGQYAFQSLNGPVAAIPPLIYFFGLSAYPNWVTLAWGASLVIVGIMLVISIVARLAAGNLASRGGMGGGG